MQASQEPTRTGCPSPYNYKEAILGTGADEIFVVTISSKLSGSYNAAKTAVEEVKREHPEKKSPSSTPNPPPPAPPTS